jgi:fatty acid desaturase
VTKREPEPPETKPHANAHLRPLRVRGGIVRWSVTVAVVSGICLFLITGLAASPWVFLLYPLLIGALLLALCALALHLLHRL